jgi:hypothetical protein
MPKGPTLTVRCVGCKAKRVLDQDECARLAERGSVPMCETCFMPMVAESVSA